MEDNYVKEVCWLPQEKGRKRSATVVKELEKLLSEVNSYKRQFEQKLSLTKRRRNNSVIQKLEKHQVAKCKLDTSIPTIDFDFLHNFCRMPHFPNLTSKYFVKISW